MSLLASFMEYIYIYIFFSSNTLNNNIINIGNEATAYENIHMKL